MIPYNEKKIVDPKCVPVAEPCCDSYPQMSLFVR